MSILGNSTILEKLKPEAKFQLQQDVYHLQVSVYQTNCTVCSQYLGGGAQECDACGGCGVINQVNQDKSSIKRARTLYSTAEEDTYAYSLLFSDGTPTRVVTEKQLYATYQEASEALRSL